MSGRNVAPQGWKSPRFVEGKTLTQRLVKPVQQSRPRLQGGDIELLEMGVRTLAVDAETVEVAVRAAVKLPSEPPPVKVSTSLKPMSSASDLACSNSAAPALPFS